MTPHRLACLLAGGLTLALATGFWTSLSASHPPSPSGTVEVLVDGTPRPRYLHAGRWYVEALKGREYAIRLHNPYDVRVAVALAVDGLNSIDARETSADGARKWVIDPHQTVVISGWQTSRRDARRFEFTTESRSYGEALGKTANLGLISAAFFRERVPVYYSSGAGAAARESDRQASAPAAPPPAAQAETGAAARAQKRERDEYAATGMGRRTDHAVTQVWLDLEDTPAHTVDIRYEFGPQLARLGIRPAPVTVDPLTRRERARGFEPGFAPDPARR
jgi:hypothetical protein